MRLKFFKFYPWKIKLEYNEYLYPPLPTLRAIELWSNRKTAGDIPGYLVFQNGGSVCLTAFNVMAGAFVVSGYIRFEEWTGPFR